MSTATELRSGKGHTDENFPVAKFIQKRHRAPILAFYRFVRAADDVADHPTLTPDQKLALLDSLDAALTGEGAPDEEAEPLRHALAERGLTPRHARDLLDAFRLDAKKSRYADFTELMAYCSLSAMPVGRFVLDVHGEDPQRTWAASDAICAALQILNHLQDCGKDYASIDRVYIPAETFEKHGARIEDLGAPKATPQLRGAIADLAARTEKLLEEGRALPDLVADIRLAAELSAIYKLAHTLIRGLQHRDPLSEKVHFSKIGFATTALAAVTATMIRRALRRSAAPAKQGAL